VVIRRISPDREAGAPLRVSPFPLHEAEERPQSQVVARRRSAVVAGACMVLASAFGARADELSPFGRWLTEDRQGVVETYRCGRELCGKVVWEAVPSGKTGRSNVDDMNPDPSRRGQPICNLQVMSGFKAKSPLEWVGGSIYEPQTGKTYSAEITVADGPTMKLRGYVGIPLFGKTQVWTFEREQRPPCSGGSTS
jgi:uncharacterized protein (DUF2147 family)